MDNIFLLILVGFIIGTFGTLIGAGGGFILVPLLILTHPELPPDIITAISIAVVAANAISGSLAYAKTKRIDYKAGFLFAAFTIPGSVLGVFLIDDIPQKTFNMVFGCLLIFLAAYLIIKKNRSLKNLINERKPGYTEHIIKDSTGAVYKYNYNKNYGIIISILVGFISPLLGIGGGIIHVPAMVQWLRFPVHIATATSHFILSVMAAISVVTHFIEGSYSDDFVQKILLGLCIGVIPGAQLGAFISQRIHTGFIIKTLAFCLALVGLRILL